MILFPFNENRFSLIVADHLLVGQLCTNPKSDRSLLSCLKVTQCSTSEIGDAPLYNSSSQPIQVMTTGPLPAPSKCKSGLPRITGTCPGWWKQSFRLQIWSLMWFQVRATSCQLTSSKLAWKSTPKCAEECGDPLVQSGGQCQTLDVAARLSTGAQVQRDPGLPTTLYPSPTAPLLPRPEPAGLLRLVIRRERHQHDLPRHQSQPDHRHPPSSRRCLWKRHAPSSGSVSRRWLRLKAATLNRCQLYYIVKFFRMTISSFHPVDFSYYKEPFVVVFPKKFHYFIRIVN